MPKLDAFVSKQKVGATFVITSAMLKMTTEDFNVLAQTWIKNGGNGFQIVGVPFRKCIDGEFLIDRITAIKAIPGQE